MDHGDFTFFLSGRAVGPEPRGRARTKMVGPIATLSIAIAPPLLHALRILRSHGVPDVALFEVFRGVVIAKLCYAASAGGAENAGVENPCYLVPRFPLPRFQSPPSAWWGLAFADDITAVECLYTAQYTSRLLFSRHQPGRYHWYCSWYPIPTSPIFQPRPRPSSSKQDLFRVQPKDEATRQTANT